MVVGEVDERTQEENVEEMKEESVLNEEPEEGDEEEQDGGDNGESDGDDGEEDEDEEEPVDPVDEIREKCAESSACAKLKETFEICEERVKNRSSTEENCAQELLDFIHCQDVCVSKSLFSKLK